ncbi:hypothetical protein [Bacteroides sp. 224]|uniref:hypothetical protein n=1 Tax=Bacteroides sp. 224 TaxID=2302936 RepID=UPI0013D1F61C|nr:hypothetical protein [Bacteroides sp. 224]NDV67005.1 hypothetical protein [Bacteroides sp. 224]
MKQFFRYANLCILLLFCVAGSSCSSGKKNSKAELPEIISTDSTSRKYNLQLDFMKHHFSGMLVARRMNTDEIRIIFTTYFGLSVFDFSLKGDSLHINSCIEPMRKKKVIELLERDFKLLLLPSAHTKVKEKSSTFEKRINGSGLGKAIISLSDFQEREPQCVEIKHPWIRLKIQLNQLTIN